MRQSATDILADILAGAEVVRLRHRAGQPWPEDHEVLQVGFTKLSADGRMSRLRLRVLF